jgi:hypothetical protein
LSRPRWLPAHSASLEILCLRPGSVLAWLGNGVFGFLFGAIAIATANAARDPLNALLLGLPSLILLRGMVLGIRASIDPPAVVAYDARGLYLPRLGLIPWADLRHGQVRLRPGNNGFYDGLVAWSGRQLLVLSLTADGIRDVRARVSRRGWVRRLSVPGRSAWNGADEVTIATLRLHIDGAELLKRLDHRFHHATGGHLV